MAQIRCECGAVISDNAPGGLKAFRLFSEEDWEKRDAEPDWRRQIPYSYLIWQCRHCYRLLVFGPDNAAPRSVFTRESGRGETVL